MRSFILSFDPFTFFFNRFFLSFFLFRSSSESEDELEEEDDDDDELEEEEDDDEHEEDDEEHRDRLRFRGLGRDNAWLVESLLSSWLPWLADDRLTNVASMLVQSSKIN